jgi:hypothetical protein
MAGRFGYQQAHYEVSQACGKRVLFPAVRGAAADDLVVARGSACRHQIADLCDNRRSLHTAELLAMAGETTARDDGNFFAAVRLGSSLG